MPPVRRQGDHLRVQRQHGPGVGRGDRGDGQHPDPPLRGRPPSQLQLQERDDGDLQQGPEHRRLGHDQSHRDQPQTSSSGTQVGISFNNSAIFITSS